MLSKTIQAAIRRREAVMTGRVISSGFADLDAVLGGGYPRGRIVELYGPEGSGKTTLALHAIHEAQRAGRMAAYIDAERTFDPARAEVIGVDLKQLLLSQPESGEQALELVQALARSGSVKLVVVDSVAALAPRGETKIETMGLLARLMSQALRKLTATCHHTGTTVLFVHHLRQKIGVVFGSLDATTAGSNALKFYASVRLDARPVGPGDDGSLGRRSRVRVVKNKCAPPFGVAEICWSRP